MTNREYVTVNVVDNLINQPIRAHISQKTWEDIEILMRQRLSEQHINVNIVIPAIEHRQGSDYVVSEELI